MSQLTVFISDFKHSSTVDALSHTCVSGHKAAIGREGCKPCYSTIHVVSLHSASKHGLIGRRGQDEHATP